MKLSQRPTKTPRLKPRASCWRKIWVSASRVFGGASDPAKQNVDRRLASSSPQGEGAVHSAPTRLPSWMTVKPADSRQSPFHELELMELWDGTGKTRVRQHVNPLHREFQKPVLPPDWAAVFSDPSLPLALDIGSGYGRFLLLLQRNNPDQRVNYLGMEIRRALVDRANQWVNRLGLQGRVHYVFANATVGLKAMLASYPGPITDVFIQFPDPHFKRRHHKRRVVQPQLVHALRELMPSGGRLLFQSDVEETSVAMRNMFERYAGDAFTLATPHSECPVFYNNQPTGHCPPTVAAETSSPAAAADLECSSAADAAAEERMILEAAGVVTAARTLETVRHSLAAQPDASAGHAASRAQTSDFTQHSIQHTSTAGAAVTDSIQHTAAVTTTATATVAVRHAEYAATFADPISGSDVSTDDSDVGNSNADVSEVDSDADIATMVSEWAKGGWLVNNPVGTPTEREHHVAQQDLPVYRMQLVRR